MNRNSLISAMFMIAALYDGLLGAAFILAPLSLFNWYGVTPPNHIGYIQFPAILLVVFALMFVQIAIEPIHNRNLIPYGIGLKLAYSGIVFKYWFTTGIPSMWKPFAVIDAVTVVLFVWAYIILGQNAERRMRSKGPVH